MTNSLYHTQSLKSIYFLIDPIYAGDGNNRVIKKVEEACAFLKSEGIEACYFVCRSILESSHESTTSGLDERVRENSALVIVDSNALFEELRGNHIPAQGFLHDGNEKESFPGAKYIIMDPEDFTLDTYLKIYERAYRLPWTIAQTKRCILRECTVEDVATLYRIYDEEEVKKFLPPMDADPEKERAMMKAYISDIYELYGFGKYMAIEKETGDVIGNVGLELIGMYKGNQQEVDLGYVIAAPFRKQGYGLELCEAVIRFYFEDMEFSEDLYAMVRKDNVGSLALMEKLGFVEEKIDAKNLIDPGAWESYLRFSLSFDCWRSR